MYAIRSYYAPPPTVDYTLTAYGAGNVSDTINPASYRCVVDFGKVLTWRQTQLRAAHAGFVAKHDATEHAAFAHYREAQAHWLGDPAVRQRVLAEMNGFAGTGGAGGVLLVGFRLEERESKVTTRRGAAEARNNFV